VHVKTEFNSVFNCNPLASTLIAPRFDCMALPLHRRNYPFRPGVADYRAIPYRQVAIKNRIASVCATWYYVFRTQPSPFSTTILEDSNLAHFALKLLAVTALVLRAILLRSPKVYVTFTP
jgi:hypothetical protein